MDFRNFDAFAQSLVGDWVGRRRSATLERESVRSCWRTALDGCCLHEHWLTAGEGSSPEPTAEAFFAVSDSGPGDFIAVYRAGKIAFGESAFTDSEWTLTHRWLREPGIATIHLKFLDNNTYEQRVIEAALDGTLTMGSLAVMKRERAAI